MDIISYILKATKTRRYPRNTNFKPFGETGKISDDSFIITRRYQDIFGSTQIECMCRKKNPTACAAKTNSNIFLMKRNENSFTYHLFRHMLCLTPASFLLTDDFNWEEKLADIHLYLDENHITADSSDYFNLVDIKEPHCFYTPLQGSDPRPITKRKYSFELFTIVPMILCRQLQDIEMGYNQN